MHLISIVSEPKSSITVPVNDNLLNDISKPLESGINVSYDAKETIY